MGEKMKIFKCHECWDIRETKDNVITAHCHICLNEMKQIFTDSKGIILIKERGVENGVIWSN